MPDVEDLVKTSTRGSLILLLGEVSSTIILSVGMLVVARLLGASSYGSYAKAQSVVRIAFLVINLGVPKAMTRYIAEYRHQDKPGYIKTLIETGAIISLTASMLLTIIVYFSSGFIANVVFSDPIQEIYIKYLSISIIGFGIMRFSNSVNIGFERMELIGISQIFYSFTKSILAPVLVFIGYGTLGAIMGQTAPILLTAVLVGFFMITLYRETNPVETSYRHREAIQEILRYGLPIYLSTILSGILPHIYTTLLGIYETDTQIGNYSVTLDFAVLLGFITVPIATTILPLFSKLNYDEPELGSLYRYAVKFSTLFGYPIIWTLIALADPIITALFQTRYLFAAKYLQLYILTYVIIGFGTVINAPLLNSQKRTDLTFRSTIIAFTIVLPLSIFAIRSYGVYGLILAFSTRMVLNTLIDYLNIRRLYHYAIDFRFLVTMLLVSILDFILVYGLVSYLRINPWIELILGGILSLTVYITGLYTSRVLTKQDLDFIDGIITYFGPLTPLLRRVLQIFRNTT